MTAPKGLLLVVAIVAARPLTRAVASSELHRAVLAGNAVEVAALLAEGADVNARDRRDQTPLFLVTASSSSDRRRGDVRRSRSGRDGIGKEQLAIAKALVARGASVKARDCRGSTPLHWMRNDGDKAVAELLIEHGAEVNAKDHSGNTPLHEAVDEGNAGWAEAWLAHGADVGLRNDDGDTPLHLGFLSMARLLIAKGANVNAKNDGGRTPLHLAAEAECDDEDEPSASEARVCAAMAYMLATGADVNAIDDQGDTPLHLTAKLGLERRSQFLIANGADPGRKNEAGATPLDGAAENSHSAVVDLLRSKGTPVTIHLAVQLGQIEAVRALVQGGAHLVEAHDSNGRTPLHWAARKGHRQVAAFLISKGANVNARDEDEASPLHGCHRDVIPVLIAKGADLEAKEAHGFTPLQWAIRRSRRAAAQLLVRQGAQVDILSAAYLGMADRVAAILKTSPSLATGQRWDEKTLLHVAAERGHRDVAEILIANGADVRSRAIGHETPLCLAVKHGHHDVAELLIDKGTDVNSRAIAYGTVLNLAAYLGHERVAQVLVAKGADVDAMSSNDVTPLHWASLRGHTAIVRLLLAAGADWNTKGRYGSTPLGDATNRRHQAVVDLLRQHGARR